MGSPYFARWSTPRPVLAFSKPGGAATGILIRDAFLVPGHSYLNVFSLDPCPNRVGTGAYGGLCYNDLNLLLAQVVLPVGTPPLYFAATQSTATFGPDLVPPGFAFEAVCADTTGGSLSCLSPAVRYVVQ